MIAKTAIADNLLGLGLLSHITALVIAAVPRLEGVGIILYLIATFFLLVGAFLTWDRVGKESRFYTACAAALFPLIGPFITLKLVYSLSGKKVKEPWITSVFTLKIHSAVLLVWSLALAIAIVLTFQQYDPYFSNHPIVHPTTHK